MVRVLPSIAVEVWMRMRERGMFPGYSELMFISKSFNPLPPVKAQRIPVAMEAVPILNTS
jgi:hypothetical protein